MARIILIIAAAIIGMMLYRWIKQLPPNKRWKILMIIVGVVLLAMVLTGRLHWLFALVGALIPAAQRLLSLIAYLPVLQRLANTFKGSTPSAGQTSQVETDYLHMQLDHDSGKLTGIVKTGLFASRTLDNLSLDELMQLREYYVQHDEDSRLLLENYLDRNHGQTWRAGQSEYAEENYDSSHESGISEQEAYAILGLEPNADKKMIIEAHKRLIQKLHPDRGGSSYLAVKINQAKDILLKNFPD